jgi:hypothetical protein
LKENKKSKLKGKILIYINLKRRIVEIRKREIKKRIKRKRRKS